MNAKIVLLAALSVMLSINVFGQLLKKYDSSLVSLPMVIKNYYVHKSEWKGGVYSDKGTRERKYIGFYGTSKGYYLTNPALKDYFIKVPEAYKIYKKARTNLKIAKALVFGVGLGSFITAAIISDEKYSIPLGIGGLVSFGTGFVFSAKGRYLVLQAVPVYNDGL